MTEWHGNFTRLTFFTLGIIIRSMKVLALNPDALRKAVDAAGGNAVVADVAGVHERNLRKYCKGKSHRVTLVTMSRLLHGVGKDLDRINDLLGIVEMPD